ncbi:hypothetical protein PIB30_096187 [Stylosanthes scabra]|uniref:SCP domain-containing protein n=1 Tax=Stylosanthes scabra TaxID=79078 RepID=A0ABU6WVU2_9FABA|nr:hypothetical protein [Stylosanthes scabra]
MHSFVFVTILCNVLLIFTITKVSSQPQPQPLPSIYRRLLSHPIGKHGLHRHYHRQLQADDTNGFAIPRNDVEIPNSNQNPITDQYHNLQSVNQNPTKVVQNQQHDPYSHATPQNGGKNPIPNPTTIPNQNQNQNINENQNYSPKTVDQNPTKVLQNQVSDPNSGSSSQDDMATTISKPNTNPISNPNQDVNESQNNPLNSVDQNQNKNPTISSQTQGSGSDIQDKENNKNPGKLFGWTPNNEIMASDTKALLADEFLHAHNWVRSKYNLPLYTWDEDLESVARKYLMERYDDCKVIHSNYAYGENLFWGKKLHWTPSDIVYFWYTEKDWYDFEKGTCFLPPSSSSTRQNRLPKICGHFTQIIWRDSLRVGCGLQHCNDRNAGMLIVCEYDPPGNYANENPLEKHT